MQKSSVTIITEKQSAAVKNKTILHTISIICDVVDVSNKLNKNLSVISSKSMVEWIRILSFLSCKFGYGAKFICMIKVAYTNIQSKIKINGLLSDPFTLMQGVRQGFPLSLVFKTYLRVRINDLVLWTLVGCFLPSSIISVSENVMYHLQKQKFQPTAYWRENDMM